MIILINTYASVYKWYIDCHSQLLFFHLWTHLQPCIKSQIMQTSLNQPNYKYLITRHFLLILFWFHIMIRHSGNELESIIIEYKCPWIIGPQVIHWLWKYVLPELCAYEFHGFKLSLKLNSIVSWDNINGFPSYVPPYFFNIFVKDFLLSFIYW